MTARYGTLDTTADRPAADVRLVFHDDALELRWAHCSQTADFICDLFGGIVARSGRNVAAARHAIAYLTNELLENAVKFRAPGDVELEATIAGGAFSLWMANNVTMETAGSFQALLAEIVAGDPGELLIARIEANAESEGDNGSGLGILTLMNDYGVELGWSFAPAGDGSVRLETLAFIALT